MNATLYLASPVLLLGLAMSAGSLTHAPTAPGAAPASAEAANYAIDGSHSFAMFRVNHLGIGVAYGQFRQLGGEVVYDPAKPETSSISITIDPASVDTNNEGRDKHLRGTDFFSVKEFPEASFRSSAVEVVSADQFRVTGTLKLHGVEKEITAKVRKIGEGKGPRGKDRVGFEAEFEIDRLAFGIDYMPKGLGQTVHLAVAIEGVKAE